MCWTTLQVAYPQYIVAKEDVPIIKALMANNFSPYQGFKYIFNEKYPLVPIKIIQNSFWGKARYEIHKGYHSYVSDLLVTEGIFTMSLIKPNGLILTTLNKNIKFYQGYIPKGTKYCINEFSEIVSETIVLTGSIVEAKSIEMKVAIDDNGKVKSALYNPNKNQNIVGVFLEKNILFSMLDDDWKISKKKQNSSFIKNYGGHVLSFPVNPEIASIAYRAREIIKGSVDWDTPYFDNDSQTFAKVCNKLMRFENKVDWGYPKGYTIPTIEINIKK